MTSFLKAVEPVKSSCMASVDARMAISLEVFTGSRTVRSKRLRVFTGQLRAA